MREQARRCMSCGVPFCHTGCPLGNLIPEFTIRVHRGRWRTPFASFTRRTIFPRSPAASARGSGRASCVLNINDVPVAIRDIEQRPSTAPGSKAGSAAPRSVLAPMRTGKRSGHRLRSCGPCGREALERADTPSSSASATIASGCPALRHPTQDRETSIDLRVQLRAVVAHSRSCRHRRQRVWERLSSDAQVPRALRRGRRLPRVPGSRIRGAGASSEACSRQWTTSSSRTAAWRGCSPKQRRERARSASARRRRRSAAATRSSDCVGQHRRQRAAGIAPEAMPDASAALNPQKIWPGCR